MQRRFSAIYGNVSNVETISSMTAQTFFRRVTIQWIAARIPLSAGALKTSVSQATALARVAGRSVNW